MRIMLFQGIIGRYVFLFAKPVRPLSLILSNDCALYFHMLSKEMYRSIAYAYKVSNNLIIRLSGILLIRPAFLSTNIYKYLICSYYNNALSWYSYKIQLYSIQLLNILFLNIYVY